MYTENEEVSRYYPIFSLYIGYYIFQKQCLNVRNTNDGYSTAYLRDKSEPSAIFNNPEGLFLIYGRCLNIPQWGGGWGGGGINQL